MQSRQEKMLLKPKVNYSNFRFSNHLQCFYHDMQLLYDTISTWRHLLPNDRFNLLLICSSSSTWKMLRIYLAEWKQEKPKLQSKIFTCQRTVWQESFRVVQIWRRSWDQSSDIMCIRIQMWNACHSLDEWYSPYSWWSQRHQESVLLLGRWLLLRVK